MAPYAVVSCHVERPLDAECWARFAALQTRRPGGFTIAALMRPPDEAAGEDSGHWLERARAASDRGPLGHHTHFVSPEHARPATTGPEHAERVRREAAWMRGNGLAPTLFCGGGWYMDAGIAETIADLGYVDCSATAFRPEYLADDALRLAVSVPSRLVLASGARLLELPATHSLGSVARVALRPGLDAEVVHVYFHDTDLLSPRRRLALVAALAVLGRRRRPVDLDELARIFASSAPEVEFERVFAGRNADPRQ